jgi:hyperosmotically inducible protein
MKTISRTAVLAALPLALALGACHPDNPTNTSESTAGQKLDNAVATTKDDLSRAGDKINEKADNAVVAMKDAANDVRLDDAAITASVKTDILKDPDLSVLKIDVDTKDGVVTLNGLADNEAAKTRAERLASGVKGVKEVRNFLTVKHA